MNRNGLGNLSFPVNANYTKVEEKKTMRLLPVIKALIDMISFL